MSLRMRKGLKLTPSIDYEEPSEETENNHIETENNHDESEEIEDNKSKDIEQHNEEQTTNEKKRKGEEEEENELLDKAAANINENRRPDRWKKMKLVGDTRERLVDTQRIVEYHDLDGVVDKSKSIIDSSIIDEFKTKMASEKIELF